MPERVFQENTLSGEFPVTCGLKQGLVSVLMLFFIHLVATLHEQAIQELIIDKDAMEDFQS